MRYPSVVFFDETKLDAPQSVQVATTVDSRNGRVSITDGPFAETNEQIGGAFDRPH